MMDADAAQPQTKRKAADALGLLEVKGEAFGCRLLDLAAKSAPLRETYGRFVCPGKMLLFIYGSAAAVQTAIAAAKAITDAEVKAEAMTMTEATATDQTGEAGGMLITSLFLPAVHNSLWPAMTGVTPLSPNYMDCGLALVETYSVASVLEAADAMAKAASITLLRIRMASGLSGKGLIVAGGKVADLREAGQAAMKSIGDMLADLRIIPHPHPELWALV